MLELEPRYLKAVMRRAQAQEALEKYEDALEGTCVNVCACACVHTLLYYSDTVQEATCIACIFEFQITREH